MHVSSSPTTLLLARRILPVSDPPIDNGAIAVRDGRVAALGPTPEMRARFAGAESVVDLEDQVLLPAFVDAHLHLLELVRFQSGIDLDGCARRDEVLDRLRRGDPVGDWRLAFGLDTHRFEGWGGEPRRVLDAACGEGRLVVASRDLHTLFGNTAALRAAGLEIGGGVLQEADSIPLRRVLPLPDGEAWEAGLRRASYSLLRAGITRVQDFSGLPVHRRLLASQERAGRPGLPLKFTTSHHLLESVEARALDFRSGRRWGRITCGHLKLFGDGSLGSRTAWMLEPYLGTTDTGRGTYETGALRQSIAGAHRRGLRVALHAIGTAAVRQAAACLSAEDRIEHAQHLGPGDLQALKDCGCLCCVNPGHLPLDWQAAERLLPGRGQGAYPFGSYARSGIPLAFGSDAPVAPAQPLQSIAWAVCRLGPDVRPAGGWFTEERLDPAQALRAATLHAARAALADDEGQLREGACADLVALDRDPLAVPAQALWDIRVTRVWVEGVEASTTSGS